MGQRSFSYTQTRTAIEGGTTRHSMYSLNREPISDQKIVTRFFLQKLNTFLSE